MKVAVITPYHKEPRHVLETVVESVRHQTHGRVVHVMIADGFAQSWLNEAGVVHIPLPVDSDDCGDTPRAVGISFACSTGFDAITLLDADCALLPHAVASYVHTAQTSGTDVVIGRRRIVTAEGRVLNIQDEPVEDHVDSNCYCFTRRAFGVLLRWSLIPPPFHVIADRIMRLMLKHEKTPYAVLEKPTVSFTTRYAAHFRIAGETPPSGTKDPANLFDDMWRAWDATSPHVKDAYAVALGFELRRHGHGIAAGDPNRQGHRNGDMCRQKRVSW